MPPEIMRTILMDEWVIATRKYTDKRGITTVPPNNRYPIDRGVLEQIAYDYLIKEAKGCKKGYTFELINKKTGEIFKVTVERVIVKWCGCGDELRTDEDIKTGKCGICRSLE